MRILSILFILLLSISIQSQELNAKLTINAQKIPSQNQELFSNLETSLNQLLNDQKWTNVAFAKKERIDCNIMIYINENPEQNTYIAEMQITARRPVYNSTYVTSTFNYRDTQFDFDYMHGLSLDFNSMSIDNNLVAVISFYAYIILGLDFDSFSPNGGRPYFDKAMEIANMAQGLNTKGWEPFSGKNNNRYDLAIALTEESSASFHTLWYNYHRLGLDDMAANPSRGRIRIIESLDDIQKLYDARPSSLLLAMLAETKIDEIVRVASEATAEEKQEIKKMLTRIFPTKSSLINSLK